MINKGFGATKATLVFHQEFPVGIRKRFEGCRRSRGSSRLLPPIAGTIGIAGAVKVAEAIGTGELRGPTMRTRGHRSRSIRGELIARRQCFFNAQCATDEGIPGLVLDRWLRDNELLDVMKK